MINNELHCSYLFFFQIQAPAIVIYIKFFAIDILPMLTFLTDPLIYGVRMREIRRAYHRLLAAVLPCCVREPKRKIDRTSSMRMTSIETNVLL